jgi:hypothetical protein
MQLTPKQVKSMIENASVLELELIWIPKIMERQTSEEQEDEYTKEHNGVGLNAFDATFITRLHKKIQEGERLNVWEAKKAREKLMKYSKQYVEMAENRKNAMGVNPNNQPIPA